jgi:hypothetical protein
MYVETPCPRERRLDSGGSTEQVSEIDRLCLLIMRRAISYYSPGTIESPPEIRPLVGVAAVPLATNIKTTGQRPDLASASCNLSPLQQLQNRDIKLSAFMAIRWFSLMVLTINPALSLYGLLHAPFNNKTVAFAWAYYVFSMIGKSWFTQQVSG